MTNTSAPAGLKMSLRRTLLIAKRDFVGYIKTWGFWLSALGPFIGIVFGVMAPFIMAKSEPTQYASILDETGLHGSAIEQLLIKDNEYMMKLALREVAKYTVPRTEKENFKQVLDTQGPEAAKAFITKTNPRIASYIKMPKSKLTFIPAPTADHGQLNALCFGRQKNYGRRGGAIA